MFSSTPKVFLYQLQEPFLLQLHVTERCNLRCKHCYNEEWTKDLEWSLFLKVLEDFQELLQFIHAKGLVQLTGGEPLLWKSLVPALTELRKHHIASRLLTNGTLLTPQLAFQLKQVGLKFAQVSLDGLKETHEFIRGKGTYQKAWNGIQALLEAGIETTIMFTAMKSNYKDVSELVHLADQKGVHRFAVGRFIPIGTGKQLPFAALSPRETYDLFLTLKKLQDSVQLEIVARDPLWSIIQSSSSSFSLSSPPKSSLFKRYGGCSAGEFLLDVLVDGTVLPCRRLPVAVGSVQQQTLMDIWLYHPFLKKLRDRSQWECASCRLLHVCGGCRGIALGMTGNPFAKDPQCFLSLSLPIQLDEPSLHE